MASDPSSLVASAVSSSLSSSSASGALSQVVQNALHRPEVVGGMWLICSAIFTTYSTNQFLKYQPENNNTDDDDDPLTLLESAVNLEEPTAATSIGKRTRPGLSIPLLPPKLVPMLSRRRPVSSTTPQAVTPLSGTPSQTATQRTSWQIPRPTTLTLVRFAGSMLIGLLVHPNLDVRSSLMETWEAIPAFILPAIFLFTANFTNSMSLNRIGISLTYTSKCSIPLITVLLTAALHGRQALPNTWALLSLLPIAAGIAAASWQSPVFERVGFFASMVSATAQSALNVSSKRAMTQRGISGPASQRVMVTVGLVIAVVVAGIQSLSSGRTTTNNDEDSDTLAAKSATTPAVTFRTPLWLYSAAILSYHLEYVLSFMFVTLVQPVTFGASDAIRRLCIILSGRAMFGGSPLTLVNQLGIALALVGALCYSVTA